MRLIKCYGGSDTLIARGSSEQQYCSKNRAEGDDIIGDTYEYLMWNFAMESGKSKGQFYILAGIPYSCSDGWY